MLDYVMFRMLDDAWGRRGGGQNPLSKIAMKQCLGQSMTLDDACCMIIRITITVNDAL